MQNTAIVPAKDSSLQKELLSKAHVAVREDEREALAFGFVMELRSIAGSDKRHSSTPLRRICNLLRGSCSINCRVEQGLLRAAATVQCCAGRAQSRHPEPAGGQPIAWRRRGLSTMIEWICSAEAPSDLSHGMMFSCTCEYPRPLYAL